MTFKQLGFAEFLDAEPMNGTHLIRAASVTALRPKWDDAEIFVGTWIYTSDGSRRLVAESPDEIETTLSAMQD